MSAFLVRHAKAGSRHRWDGDDRHRPLSTAGWRQAEGIARRLAHEQVTSLWSSPSRRCVETLEPLAADAGLEIIADDRLAEAAGLSEVLELLRNAGDGAVLCSHGDVVPDVVDGLMQRGATLRRRTRLAQGQHVGPSARRRRRHRAARRAAARLTVDRKRDER